MQWTKRGQIFTFSPVDDFLQSHASNPLAVWMHDDVFRVFYSGRNRDNRSSVGFVDIDIVAEKVVGSCDHALFTFGDDESFYSHGVSVGNLYRAEGNNYIQFMGWQIRNGGHWRGDIGRLRVGDDMLSMHLDPETIFLGCDDEDGISLSYSWVMEDEGIYKMWYGSTIDWSSPNGEMVHVIKYATSKDGEVWERHGLAVPCVLGIAQAFSRPTVLKDLLGYHMWYSYRSGDGTKYRIGYAGSRDGIHWERGPSGIDVSETGWDSEMICYPFVFEHKRRRYMLYNGNAYGKEGFGLAVMEDE